MRPKVTLGKGRIRTSLHHMASPKNRYSGQGSCNTLLPLRMAAFYTSDLMVALYHDSYVSPSCILNFKKLNFCLSILLV